MEWLLLDGNLLLVELRLNGSLVERLLVELLGELLCGLRSTGERVVKLWRLLWWTGFGLGKVRNEVGLSVVLEVLLLVIDWCGD